MKRALLLLVSLLFHPGCTSESAVIPAAEQVRLLRESGVALSDSAGAMLTAFLENTHVRVATCAEADLTADGVAEVIVIHGSLTEQGKMTLRVLLQTPEGVLSSNELPAPVENQRITLRDIDEKPPLEFVVMGSKGIYSGFAIYRMVDGVLTDLFDDGMDGCC